MLIPSHEEGVPKLAINFRGAAVLCSSCTGRSEAEVVVAPSARLMFDESWREEAGVSLPSD
ncbi:hypothetical protein VTN77DRAFT_475 [Rasamsonia byssochlamydoides]|uniref:uncharacterized protein n=1 Tax=Rasamsonia byssochlamydoides TaxID=89139 RepID=UPI003741F8A5